MLCEDCAQSLVSVVLLHTNPAPDLWPGMSSAVSFGVVNLEHHRNVALMIDQTIVESRRLREKSAALRASLKQAASERLVANSVEISAYRNLSTPFGFASRK